MDYPLEIGLGEYKISGHLLFESLAFIIGFRYFSYIRKKKVDKISDSNRVWILIGAAFGAFFFSRLIGAFETPIAFFNSGNKLLYFYANKTIVGGLLGGLIIVELIKKIINENHSSGDLLTFPLIMALIIGRVGCFTSGVYEETYGDITNSYFGIDLGDGFLRHPVTLYEIAFLVLITFLITLLERENNLKDGYRFQLFMIFYLSFRFILDFIKPGYTFFWSIGTIQICCIIGLWYYRTTISKLIFNKSSLFVYGNH